MRYRNTAILSIGTALGRAGAPLLVLIGGIIGAELAPSPALATLPIAFGVIGVAAFSIPSALLMQRIGRKRGFILGTLMAAVAWLVAAYAVSIGSFALFCVAIIFSGGNMAFIQQYRFAAAESVEPRYVSRAVSFVLLGGVVAGFLGPEIGTWAKDWLGGGLYTGSLVAMAGLLFSFHWGVAVVLFAAAVPGVLVRLKYSGEMYRWQRQRTETERKASYLNWMLTGDTHAKEIRLFGLGDLFRHRFGDVRTQLRGERLEITRKRSVAELVAQASATVALFGSFGFIAYRTLYGTITLGDMVMYFQAFQKGLGYLREMLGGVADLY